MAVSIQQTAWGISPSPERSSWPGTPSATSETGSAAALTSGPVELFVDYQVSAL